jgi:hypothetical protein
MGKLHIYIIICLVGSLLFFAIGCTRNQAPISWQLQQNRTDIDSASYAIEIAKLEKIIQEDRDSSEKMRAHLRLAHLYTSYKNPKRNYQKALEHLEIYASLYPPIGDQQDLRDWLSTLKEIERLSLKLRRQNKIMKQIHAELNTAKKERLAVKEANTQLEVVNLDFQSTNDELKIMNAKLKARNLKLTQTIEMLKNLDRNVEEKRKNFNTQ